MVVFCKILIPVKAWSQLCSLIAVKIAEAWISGNKLLINATQSIDWDIEGCEGLDRKTSYFVICNHQSWMDIVVLQHVFNRKIPLLRFFLKKQLLFFPILGFAFWALDFPFVRRYSAETLKAQPKLRNRDRESVRKRCQRLKKTPVSILNFLEGTRYCPEKHKKQRSPYHHLLKPKVGGLALALEAMGEQFSVILDVTIVFPPGPTTLWDLLTERIHHIVVRVSKYEIPTEFLQSHSMDDPVYREQIKKWVTEIWERKDQLIEQLRQDPNPYPI